MNNKTTVRFFCIMEVLSLLYCGALHLLSFLRKTEFPLQMYWIIPLVMLVTVALALWAFVPIICWIFFENDDTEQKEVKDEGVKH